MITNVSHLLRPSHDCMYADLKHCQLQSQVPVHAVGERVCFGFVVYQRPISLSVCALIIQILYIYKKKTIGNYMKYMWNQSRFCTFHECCVK